MMPTTRLSQRSATATSDDAPPIRQGEQHMKKGIYLQATFAAGGANSAAIQAALQAALVGTHDALTIQLKRLTTGPGGKTGQAILYLEGEQAPPDDFEALTSGVVRRLWQDTLTHPATGPALALQKLAEQDDYDEEDNNVD